MTEKQCSKCRQYLPVSLFGTQVNYNGRRYLNAWCKPCKAAGSREWRQRNYSGYQKPLTFFQYGERSHKAKLSNHDITLIRGLLADGLSCAEIARKFEVSRATISGIKNGRYWEHVA